MSNLLLQWGHDFDVVEDMPMCIQPTTGLPELQWGHDFDVVEDDPDAALVDLGLKLQWGHDFDVVEDTEYQPTVYGRSKSFNGATTLTSWKTPRRTAAN